MKRTFAAVIAVLFMASAGGMVFAAGQKDPGKWQEKRLERLAADLNLTAEQKDKVSAILAESVEQTKAAMEKVRAIRTDTDQKIQSVLTAEQAKKFEQLKAERREKMKGNWKERHAGRGKGCMQPCPNCEPQGK